jgi:hypothetical protein
VSESHQAHTLTGLHALDECRHVLHAADFREHAEDRFVRAAVQGSIEGRRRARQRRIGIGVRAADAAHRMRAAVLLVISVQDEQHVEGALQDRMDLVARLAHPEQHVQEVTGVAQLVVRQHVRPPNRVTERIGGNAGHLRDEPNGMQPA